MNFSRGIKRFFFGNTKSNVIALGIFLFFYIVFGLVVTRSQERMIYLPGAQNFSECPALRNAEQISFEGTRLYFRNNGPMVGVMYHGNASSACDNAFMAQLLDEAGYSYVLPEYTGYSNDSSTPSHAAIKQDVRHVIDFLSTRHFEHAIVIGQSIGTGVATYHASIQPPAKLILISPFSNLTDVARARFWYYPVALMVDNAFDNVDLLSQYRGSLLVLHGDKDSTIPESLGEKLFSTVSGTDKRMVIIHGAGHNDMFEFSETYIAIKQLLRK